MKQLKSGLFKSSNLTFDPSKISAHSYAWWEFVRVLKGKVVFNEYKYSVTTAKHQRTIRNLMSELGIEIDLKVNVRESLSRFNNLNELKKTSLQTTSYQLAEKARLIEERRVRNNERAKQKRLLAKGVK